jgi:TonB family protein
MRVRWIAIVMLSLCCWAQDKHPRVVRKKEPEYTDEARRAEVQGTIVLGLIVDEHGKPADIHVLNPLGFGLDERAVATVEKWVWEPGTKDGNPASVYAEVEVNFRLRDHWFDDANERRRVQYNLAIDSLNATGEKRDKAVKTLQALARQKYPAAMRMVGQMLAEGKLLPKDDKQSVALITKAAQKHHGPAMYDLGRMYLDGKQATPDRVRGLKLIADAAVLGSVQAQFFLGLQYEAGTTVPRDPERSRRYFRLCAAAGDPVCQFRLGTSMLERPERRDWEKVQAVAWLELAAGKGLSGARERADRETPSLAAQERSQVATLKRQFTRRQ